jgi:hypothetical protein
MQLKSIIATAVATALCAAAPSTTLASTYDFNFTGLFTVLDATGNKISNSSHPYYSDPTWGYGARTPISGTLSYDAFSGTGTSTINYFDFFSSGPAVISDFEFKSVGGGLLVGNMNFNWGGSIETTQFVLDASGLISAINNGLNPLDTLDSSYCTTSGDCAMPASNFLDGGQYSLGSVPIATTAFNTMGQTGFGTTLSQLSLGTDDGIGGSPADNGPFSGTNFNFDFTSLTVTAVPEVPVPAAAWLFGSGLVGLIGVARRKKRTG